MKYLILTIFLTGCTTFPATIEEKTEIKVKSKFLRYKDTCRWVVAQDINGEGFVTVIPMEITCRDI